MLPPPPRSTLFPYTTLFRSSDLTAFERSDVRSSYVRRKQSRSVAPNFEPRTPNVRTAVRLAGDYSARADRKSTRLNSSHSQISYAVFCLKKKMHVLARLRRI